MDFDHMDDMYEQVTTHLPNSVQHEWVTQRFDPKQPLILGLTLVLIMVAVIGSRTFWGESISEALVGLIQIGAGLFLWLRQPSTRINPEYKGWERACAVMFFVLGLSRLLQAYFSWVGM
jgi:hypothetical protein